MASAPEAANQIELLPDTVPIFDVDSRDPLADRIGHKLRGNPVILQGPRTCLIAYAAAGRLKFPDQHLGALKRQLELLASSCHGSRRFLHGLREPADLIFTAEGGAGRQAVFQMEHVALQPP